ncbi:MAG: hypothetical protein QM766_02960 [Burkholderiaceae bacterium]
MTVKAYGAHASGRPLEPMDITRRAPSAHVVAFTTSESKHDAAKALGADEVVVSRHPDEMAAHAKSFDFIDCASLAA